jgi:hypothetical protein
MNMRKQLILNTIIKSVSIVEDEYNNDSFDDSFDCTYENSYIGGNAVSVDSDPNVIRISTW